MTDSSRGRQYPHSLSSFDGLDISIPSLSSLPTTQYRQIVGNDGIAPCQATWNAIKIQPHYPCATPINLPVAAVNIGGIIVSTWLFTGSLRVHKATCITLTFSFGTAMIYAILIFYFRSENVPGRGALSVDIRGGHRKIAVGTLPKLVCRTA